MKASSAAEVLRCAVCSSCGQSKREVQRRQKRKVRTNSTSCRVRAASDFGRQRSASLGPPMEGEAETIRKSQRAVSSASELPVTPGDGNIAGSSRDPSPSQGETAALMDAEDPDADHPSTTA